MSVMEQAEIQALLPHRYPFLLVDRIQELDPDRRIVGIKNVTINEPFFQGHFPGRPVMPGVLILEAMSQVGAILAFKSLGNAARPVVYLTGVDGAKFRKPVVPGDQLRFDPIGAASAAHRCRPARNRSDPTGRRACRRP